MTPSTDEAQRLIRLARRDFQTFSILNAHPDAAIAAICFHAQQCVEKSFKAVLTENQIFFRYTHDLAELANLLTEAGVIPPYPLPELQRLTPFAVELRYDEGIPLLTREEAASMATKTLAWAEEHLAETGAA